jgi:hypothetical protein
MHLAAAFKKAIEKLVAIARYLMFLVYSMLLHLASQGEKADAIARYVKL